MLGSVGGDNTASVSGGKTVAIQRRRTVDFLRVDDQSTDATNDIRSKRTRLDLRSVIIIFATSRWLQGHTVPVYVQHCRFWSLLVF